MKKYLNKYRSESNRRPRWDYSADALYFLTIVTQHRNCNLGSIINKEMVLSDFGNIVETEWYKSFEIRQELFLHAFILMPNHLHTIVEIRGKLDGAGTNGRLSRQMNSIIPTDSIDPIKPTNSIDTEIISIKRNPPVRLPKSISSFIAGFKSAVNTKIDDYIDDHQLKIPKYNKQNHFFQPNYHDHIIRNHPEYLRIKNYIISNPLNWGKDKLIS